MPRFCLASAAIVLIPHGVRVVLLVNDSFRRLFAVAAGQRVEINNYIINKFEQLLIRGGEHVADDSRSLSCMPLCWRFNSCDDR